MECCNLDYIPERLHYKDDLAPIKSFLVKDTLYRRINEQIKDNPYGSISLVDLSHNIGVNNTNELSKGKDVLFSILIDDGIEIYESFSPLKLEIKSLNKNHQYDKIFVCEKNKDLKVRIFLQHDPVLCMYPHCVFQFFIYMEKEEIEVAFDNYKSTLGQKKYKYLRDKLRQEIALMIIREVISYDDII